MFFIVRGDGIGDGTNYYIGPRGSTPSGSPPSSQATFIVPEGYKHIMALGFESFDPATFIGVHAEYGLSITYSSTKDEVESASGAQTLKSDSRRFGASRSTPRGARLRFRSCSSRSRPPTSFSAMTGSVVALDSLRGISASRPPPTSEKSLKSA